MPKISIKAFNALPKAKKRVLVAKDILKQIDASEYKPNTGGYIIVNNSPTNLDAVAKGNMNQLKGCEVCELGACLISISNFANTLTLRDIISPSTFSSTKAYGNAIRARKLLLSVFSKRQLALLEACFEGCRAPYAEANFKIFVGKEIKIGEKYANQFYSPTSRMIAISKNIIRNKGKFTPKQDIK